MHTTIQHKAARHRLFLFCTALSLLLAAAVTSCRKDDDGSENLVAEFENYHRSANGKVYIDDENYACWIAGDAVKINGTNYGIVITDPDHAGNSGVKQAKIPGVTKADTYVGAYPAARYSYVGGQHRFAMPYKQTYRTETTIDGTRQVVEAPMFGVSFDDGGKKVLKFRNAASLLRVRVTPKTGDATFTVNKIVVTASNAILNGTGHIDDPTGENPTLVMDEGKSSVMLDCGETEITTATDFIIVLPPVSNADNKFTIDVVAQNTRDGGYTASAWTAGIYRKFNNTQGGSADGTIGRSVIGVAPADMSSATPTKYGLLGSGTSVSPWQIATRLDLHILRNLVKKESAYRDDYYKQMCDIDATRNPFAGTTQTWINIPDTSSVQFMGTYDGDNDTVWLNLNPYYSAQSKGGNGFFSAVQGATIMNLTLKGADVSKTGLTSGYSAGAFAGNVLLSATTTMTNCVSYINFSYTSSSSDANTFNLGGLVGNVNTSSTLNMTNCHNYGNVTYTNSNTSPIIYLGGLVGYGGGIMSLSNCSNSGNVSKTKGAAYYAGGLVAKAAKAFTASNCQNKGNVTNSNGNAAGICAAVSATSSFTNCTNDNPSVRGTISGTGYLGGICAYAQGACTFSSCTNTHNVSGGAYYIGGILGHFNLGSSSCTFTSCSNSGSVIGTTTSYGVGGIAGRLYGSSTTFTFSGTISNSGNIKAQRNCGGIVGMNDSGPLSICPNSSDRCTNSGKVEINSTSSCYKSKNYFGFGGIVGFTSTASSVNRCNNTGGVDGTRYKASSTYYGYAGGIVGYAGNAGFSVATSSSSGTIRIYNYNEGNWTTDVAGQKADIVGGATRVTSCSPGYPG